MTMRARSVEGLPGPVGAQVRELQVELRAALDRRGATNVRIVGSVARGEDTEESDLDVLVDLPLGTSLFDQAGLMLDLQELLGRRVDVLTPGALDQRMAAAINADAVPL